eukprot:15963138-Heterocapsa_arctica.AAC.1
MDPATQLARRPIGPRLRILEAHRTVWIHWAGMQPDRYAWHFSGSNRGPTPALQDAVPHLQ